MHIDDCTRDIIEFLEVNNKMLPDRVYNFGAFCTNIDILLKKIKKIFKEFQISYDINHLLNTIFQSLPSEFDYSQAKRDWQWKPKITSADKLIKNHIMKSINLEEDKLEEKIQNNIQNKNKNIKKQ